MDLFNHSSTIPLYYNRFMREKESPEKRDIRPDHGDTQVHNPQELQVEGRYIFHYRDQKGRKKEDRVKVIGPPSSEATFQYPPGTETVGIEFSFIDNFGFKGKSVRRISFPDLGLAPHIDGIWEQDRWLEDPLKIRNDRSGLTQKWELPFPIPFF